MKGTCWSRVVICVCAAAALPAGCEDNSVLVPPDASAGSGGSTDSGLDSAVGCEGGRVYCSGTCVDLMSDPAHCGACSTPCNASHATATCSGGSCAVTCSKDWGDCNGDVNDACETNLATTVAHCGACNKDCSSTNGTASCASGLCKIACAGAFADCDGMAETGCEVNTDADKKNCGSCGHDCLGGDCAGGKCQPIELANGQTSAAAIRVDAAGVYWSIAVASTGKIMKVALSGGTPVILADNQDFPNGICLANGAVYWAVWLAGGAIMSVPTGGGTVTTIKGASGLQLIDVAIHGGNAYTIAVEGLVLKVVAVPAGATTQLASGQNGPAGVVANANGVFWSNSGSAGGIMRAPIDGDGGTAPDTLASLPNVTPMEVALDDTHAYWVTRTGGEIQKIEQLGVGKSVTTLVTVPKTLYPHVNGLALDADHVYFASPNGGFVYRVSKAGGALETLASNQQGVNGVAVDDKAIYWLNSTAGAVMKLAK
jgi:hypothetical protein